MPELPEVETVVRGLNKVVKSRGIIDVYKSKFDLRVPCLMNLQQELYGSKILSVYRIAKYIVIETNQDKSIVIHLGISGRLLFKDNIYKKYEKHDHVIFFLSGGCSIIYNDPRRFGLVSVMDSSDILNDKLFQNLGVEPLSSSLNYQYLLATTSGKNVSIKQFLMNAKYIVGIGNIYANEILHLAKISPLKPAKELTNNEIKLLVKSIKQVLNFAIDAGGSSLRDYIAPSGILGNFQNYFKVYNQESKTCLTCGKGIVSKIVIAQRSTYYCPECQK